MAGRQLFTSGRGDRRGCEGILYQFLSFLRLRRPDQNNATPTTGESKKRVHRKDRIIHVDKTFEVMDEYDEFLEGEMSGASTAQLQAGGIFNPASIDVENAGSPKEARGTTFGTVQDSAWKVAAAVDNSLDATHRVIKRTGLLEKSPARPKVEEEEETELSRDEFYARNPPNLYPQHDNAVPGMASNITEKIFCTFTRRGARPSILPPGYIRKSGKKGIEVAVELGAAFDVVDWELADYFIAATTAQIGELSRETLDRARVFKAYIGPPTSPVPETVEADNSRDELTVTAAKEDNGYTLNPNRGLIDMTPEQILNYADFTPIAFNPHTVQKDLAKRLGVRNNGIQVLGTNLPSTYDSPDNLSEYYGMPLIESAEQTKSNYIFKKTGDNDKSSTTSLTDPDGNDTENVFYPIHVQPPSQSLILYLTGRGLSIVAVAKMLANLDEKFVYEWDSRWFNGLRIPNHWEFNDDTVHQVKLKCRAEEQWWAADLDSSGTKLPSELRLLRERMRTRKATYFVKKTLENYLWWRCRMGEICHSELVKTSAG